MEIRLPRVFRHKNYRIFFVGQLVALMGTWMKAVALGWLVYRLTDSAFLLGLVTFMQQAPLFFVSPFAGAIADRLSRRNVFVATQAVCMVQAALLAVLTFTGVIDVWMVIVLSLVLGLATGIEAPVRQSFTIEMVGRDDLREAIAYNAMMFNLARSVGPALGGIIVAVAGEAVCFLINTFSYAAVITSLLAMRLPPREARPESHPLDDLRLGFSYVVNHPKIRAALFLSAMTGFFGMSFIAILPAYARDVLGQQSFALGFILGAFGAGAFVGAAAAGKLPERHIDMAPIAASAAMGLTLIVLANVASVPFAIAFILPAGFSWLMIAVTNNSQIQIMSEDSFRGRVMGFYAMSALGSQALGSLLLGSLADLVGVPVALMLGGAACLAGAAVCLRWQKKQGE
jgi:MFS family permease